MELTDNIRNLKTAFHYKNSRYDSQRGSRLVSYEFVIIQLCQIVQVYDSREQVAQTASVVPLLGPAVSTDSSLQRRAAPRSGKCSTLNGTTRTDAIRQSCTGSRSISTLYYSNYSMVNFSLLYTFRNQNGYLTQRLTQVSQEASSLASQISVPKETI